jgi:dTDP-4-amino-4,6-dideoxy-D-galactose acyltransferase
MMTATIGIDALEWDSNFFGFKIGRVFINKSNASEIAAISELIKNEQFKMLYVILNEWDDEIHEKLQNAGAKLIDKKTTYVHTVTAEAKTVVDFPVVEYADKYMTPELIELAYASGKYSRFLIDKGFGKKSFEKLYMEWLTNSLNGKFADKLWVATDREKVIGFVTAKRSKEDNSGQVGLIAVSEAYRGRKIGHALMSVCNDWYLHHNLQQATVVTQGDNKAACKFYEAVGYHVGKVEYYYHLWT